jgi:hypothetical protein
LLCRRSLKQRLQLLAHSSLLRGRRLRAAAQQHGRSGKVLGRPPKKWRCIGVRVVDAKFAPYVKHTASRTS